MRIATARPVLTLLLATCLGVLQPATALAWIYPEHRDMTVLAVQRLEPAAPEAEVPDASDVARGAAATSEE